MSSTYVAQVIVSIPSLCQTVRQRVNLESTVAEFIKSILASVDVEPSPDFHLFGINSSYYEIHPDDSCMVFIRNQFDSLKLLTSNTKCVHVVYEDRRTLIALEKDSDMEKLISLAISCLKLPYDEKMYIPYNPFNNSIYPLDLTFNFNLVLLKSFDNINNPLLFNFSQFTYESAIMCYPVAGISKKILSPVLSKLLSCIKIKKQKEYKITKLSSNVVNSFFDKAMNNGNLDEFSIDEFVSILFLILSYSEYIHEDIHKSIILRLKNQTPSNKLEIISIIILLLPLSTHCLLFEICQCFATACFDQNIIELLANILFPSSIDRKIEEEFCSYLLVFQNWLFRLPARPGKSICISNNELLICIVKNGENEYFTVQGKLITKPDKIKSYFWNPVDLSLTNYFNSTLIDQDYFDTKELTKLNNSIKEIEELNKKKEMLLEELYKML